MTKEEALTSHAISRVVMYAIKSARCARDAKPSVVNSHTESAEFYARWLVDNGHGVELEIVKENGLRRVVTLVVDGRKLIQNGAYVSQK